MRGSLCYKSTERPMDLQRVFGAGRQGGYDDCSHVGEIFLSKVTWKSELTSCKRTDVFAWHVLGFQLRSESFFVFCSTVGRVKRDPYM